LYKASVININASLNIQNLSTPTLTKEIIMSESLKDAVIQAVFHRQLNTDRAVKFIVSETGVTPTVAVTALKQVFTRRA